MNHITAHIDYGFGESKSYLVKSYFCTRCGTFTTDEYGVSVARYHSDEECDLIIVRKIMES